MRTGIGKIGVVAFVFLSFNAKGQTPDWIWARDAECIGIFANGEGNTIVLDHSENIYFTGYYDYTIVFGTDTFISNNTDAFLVKYDSIGNLLWAKSTISPGVSVTESFGLTVDNFGSVFVSGRYFGGAPIFDTIQLDSTIGGSEAIFLAKYDSSGNVLWVRTSNDLSHGYCYSVAADAQGNSYITGFYISSSITFSPYTLTNTSNSNVFIVKYDPSGNVIWAKNVAGIGAESLDKNESYGITIDPSANVYITGNFYSPTLTIGSYTMTNSGLYDAFLAKFDSSGNVLWARSGGGISYDGGVAVITNSDNSVYVAGNFSSPLITFSSDTLTNIGAYNVFLMKYDSSGNVIWAKSSEDSSRIQTSFLSMNESSTIYMSGGQGGSLNHASIRFGNLSLQVPPNITDPMFFVKFDSSGNALCGGVLPTGGDDNNSIAVAPSNNIYIAADFVMDSLILGNDTLFLTNGETPFIARLNLTCAPLGLNSSIEQLDDILIYPNPSYAVFYLNISTKEEISSITVYNCIGEKVYEQGFGASSTSRASVTSTATEAVIDLTKAAAGIYFYSVGLKDGSVARGKLVKE